MVSEEVLSRLARMERRQRGFGAALMVVSALLVFACGMAWREARLLAHPEQLTLRRLDIVDEHGVSRVILAAPAPDPTLRGKATRRDGPVSGVILADGTGTERGGYVTGDGEESNALLTLDAQGRQTVLLLAEQGGNTLFRIWNQDKGSLVMGVADNAFLNVRRGDDVFFSTPKGNPQSTDQRRLFR